MKTKKLIGKLSMGRCRSNVREDYMRLTISDDSSGIEFLYVSIPLLAFVNAITGSGHQEVEYELRGLDHIGKKIENKFEIVERPKNYGKEGLNEAKKLIKPFEVDGWIGNPDNALNHHNWRPDNKVSVNFHRFV